MNLFVHNAEGHGDDEFSEDLQRIVLFKALRVVRDNHGDCMLGKVDSSLFFHSLFVGLGLVVLVFNEFLLFLVGNGEVKW